MVPMGRGAPWQINRLGEPLTGMRRAAPLAAVGLGRSTDDLLLMLLLPLLLLVVVVLLLLLSLLLVILPMLSLLLLLQSLRSNDIARDDVVRF